MHNIFTLIYGLYCIIEHLHTGLSYLRLASADKRARVM